MVDDGGALPNPTGSSAGEAEALPANPAQRSLTSSRNSNTSICSSTRWHCQFRCEDSRTGYDRKSPHRIDIDRVGLGVGAREARDAEPCPSGEVDAVDCEAVVLRGQGPDRVSTRSGQREKGVSGRVPRNAVLLSPASCADSGRDPPATSPRQLHFAPPPRPRARARSLTHSNGGVVVRDPGPEEALRVPERGLALSDRLGQVRRLVFALGDVPLGVEPCLAPVVHDAADDARQSDAPDRGDVGVDELVRPAPDGSGRGRVKDDAESVERGAGAEQRDVGVVLVARGVGLDRRRRRDFGFRIGRDGRVSGQAVLKRRAGVSFVSPRRRNSPVPPPRSPWCTRMRVRGLPCVTALFARLRPSLRRHSSLAARGPGTPPRRSTACT